MKETGKIAASIILLLMITAGCKAQSSGKKTVKAEEPEKGIAIATFAGGCFWCMEAPFEVLEGVKSVRSGYTYGETEHPTYRQVAAGETEHVESVVIYYDSEKITYDSLLYVFWRNIKPTQANGQFYDIGDQYKTYIFYHNKEQKEKAVASKKALEESGKFDQPIATEIVPVPDNFWLAEDYHQNYYHTHTRQYLQYYTGSGRRGYIKNTWPDYFAEFEKQKKKLKEPK